MKLSLYARKLGISYKTAWRWFKAGKLADYQADTGTIIVTDPTGEAIPTVRHQKIAIYTRVSAAEKKIIWKDRRNACWTLCVRRQRLSGDSAG